MNALRLAVLIFGFAVVKTTAQQANAPKPASSTNVVTPATGITNTIAFKAATSTSETNLVLTIDRETYSNVTFYSVTPATVSIRHSSGLATLPLWKLPPDLQKRFG